MLLLLHVVATVFVVVPAADIDDDVVDASSCRRLDLLLAVVAVAFVVVGSGESGTAFLLSSVIGVIAAGSAA